MAHTSFVMPNVFSTSSAKRVTAITSFTEDFFQPEVNVESDDFHVLLPDGHRADFAGVNVLSQLTVLETPLDADGTYRLTTGSRLGRKFQMKQVDGGWDYIRRMGGERGEPEVLPEGTVTGEFQTETVAMAYVSKGAPTAAAFKPSGRGLEILPQTHPSEIYVDQGFAFTLLFNGQPLADHVLTLYRQGGGYDDPAFEAEVTTGADGTVTLPFKAAGIYGLMTRHQGASPAGAETPYRSYTVALTFEVQR